MLSRIVIIVGVALLAFMLSGLFTQLVPYSDRRTVRRPLAYLLCVIIVFAASVVTGVMLASPSTVGPGEDVYQPGLSLAKRDELVTNIFLISVLPALLGVYAILGRKRRNVD